MHTNGEEVLAAQLADQIRAGVQQKLMESWRDGVKHGFAIARHMAQTVRDESASIGSRQQVAILDGLITALADESALDGVIETTKIPAAPRTEVPETAGMD